ncbi:MAG: hypothetical protein ACI4MG_07135, partial [Aristaeellaceae bacterium]
VVIVPNCAGRRIPKGIVQKRLPGGELPKAKLQAMLDDGKPFGRARRRETPSVVGVFRFCGSEEGAFRSPPPPLRPHLCLFFVLNEVALDLTIPSIDNPPDRQYHEAKAR